MTQDNERNTDFPKNIGRPATSALMEAGYYRLEQLTEVTEAELLQLHGVGPKAIERLHVVLEEKGLSFAE